MLSCPSREDKLATVQVESSRASKSLKIRLHTKAKKAKENPIYIDSWNNWFTSLHPACFLPGAGVPVTQLWLKA